MSTDHDDLNARAATEIMGWEKRKVTHGSCCTCQKCGWPNDEPCMCRYFTEEIEEAWLLVGRMRSLGWSYTISPDCVRFMRWVPRFDMHRAEIIRGTPWAITEAALAALAGERARKEESLA